MNALHLPARAKLNLVLRVVGRRDDGYHLLETLFHTIELHDDLWLAEHPDEVVLEVSAEHARGQVGAGADNLVVRALQRLRAVVGTRQGFRVRLHKRIPVGGGLGGGSSDAAAALRLGNRWLGEPLSAGELGAIGRELGADVPFALLGGSRWGRGVGDELSPATVPHRHFVLIAPPFDCPTAEVYKNYAPCWIDGPPQDTSGTASIPSTKDSDLRLGFSNDLTAAAESVRPELAALRQRVADLGSSSVHRTGGVHLTGSGSTLFVACADETAAIACERDLAPLLRDDVRVLRTCSASTIDQPNAEAWPTAAPPGSTSPGTGSPGLGSGGA